MGTQPYRAPSRPDPAGAPPRELVYRTGDDGPTAGRALVQTAIIGAIGAGVAAAAGSPTIAAAILVGGGVVGAWRWRRAPARPGIAIRVERGSLEITGPRGEALVRARLADVTNVSLDTKSISKVEDGNALDIAIRGDSRVRPELDVSRIVVTWGAAPSTVRLTDAYLAHMDAVEWLGKIRTFLRAHGWVPEDERADLDDEDEDVDEVAPASE